ncbi:MAG: hypothetical protein E7376_04460 [Clostridiales bacterium]|nr:hypothetical protein [Clostridiales bacterium]
MKIFYTSKLGCPKTKDNKLVTEKLDDTNGFINNLKTNLKQTKKLLFITNRWQSITPADQPKDEVFNDYHYSNKEYANVVKECYALTGISFDEIIVVDCDYKGDFKQDLLTSDLIFIQGGHTPRGLKILKTLNFEEYIKDYQGILLLAGTSAKLPATKVLSTHHGNMQEYEIEQGLNLKNYSIRPYFDYCLKLKFNKKFKNRIKLLKSFSYNIDVYALGGNSYMIDDENNIKIFGNCYLLKNGKMKKICKENKTLFIKL